MYNFKDFRDIKIVSSCKFAKQTNKQANLQCLCLFSESCYFAIKWKKNGK